MFGSAPSGAFSFTLFRLLAFSTIGKLFGGVQCASVEDWRSRSIYQILTDRFNPGLNSASGTFIEGGPKPGCTQGNGTYCGGTWRGILEKLDYIQGMNFDALWISPIVENLPQHTDDGEAYAGYWPQNLYGINTNFGEAEDLRALIDELHARGMYFMMDVVPNHMAWNGPRSEIDYSIFNPFNDEKYFHPYCPMDYSGDNLTALENCWLGSKYTPLADLNTEDPTVQEMFGEWISEMVGNWSVDGLRIDAGANVQPDFFPDFVKSAGVFAIAEVYLDNDTVASAWEATIGSILNYPLLWKLADAFGTKNDIGGLVDMMASEKKTMKDTTALGTFSENHDVPRFANHTQDLGRAANVNAFVLTHDGIPVIYYGQEQHFTGGTNPYTDREPIWSTKNGFDVFSPLYQQISTLNTLRRHVIATDDQYTTTQNDVIYHDDNVMAMKKGSDGSAVISVLSNYGSDEASSHDIKIDNTGYSSTSLTDVLSCTKYDVGDSGSVQVTITNGWPIVMFGTQQLKKSSLCGNSGDKFGTKVPTTTTATVYTTTMGGTATEIAVTATVPVVSTTETATDAASAANDYSSDALRFGVPSSESPWGAVAGAAIVFCLASGSFFGILGVGV
ncbi:alpha-amylase [Teratosphaeria nubilosa]|uniref:alpha-amylase n=1 Tax=Teratosphaeria nubilosa TaxID=161662 RepID=A0A6G1KZ39_9PEZI|nr:alpha-amylase [Teratosphaeria nubilosa]